MDPNATLQLIRDAFGGRRPNEGAQHAQDLVEWINKGGFEPQWRGEWERVVVFRMAGES